MKPEFLKKSDHAPLRNTSQGSSIHLGLIEMYQLTCLDTETKSLKLFEKKLSKRLKRVHVLKPWGRSERVANGHKFLKFEVSDRKLFRSLERAVPTALMKLPNYMNSLTWLIIELHII